MFKKSFLTLLSAIMLSVAAFAQVTTSTLTGKIVDDQGEEIIGATVVATHEPSGTTYGTVTNFDGRYTIQGMRTGGPYTVEVSYIGYQSVKFTDIMLRLGEVYKLNGYLKISSELLDEVVVVASKSKFSAQKTGATTNISSEQITKLPTINRSITDVARLSPYANGMSFAGGDGRSTNFTIDGANFNNNFGLSPKLPGGGSPISMDAIEEVQVVIAPFDVRQTNFIGGGINAVTKSGTNKFKGTAYSYYYNENMRGNRIDKVDLGDRGQDRRTIYGATLGGPIIKNKLFFFANVEHSKVPMTANSWRASEDGVADPVNFISRCEASDMQKVKDFVKKQYGYDTGSYTSFPADEENTKFLARIDWNINEDHHLAVRVNHTNNTMWRPCNGNSTNAGYRHRGYNRMSEYSMAFANSMYSMDNKVTSLSADLNSHLGDKMSNQLLATYTKIEDIRDTNSSMFPFVDIMAGEKADGSQILEPYMSLGYELFTYNNAVNNKVLTLTDNFTYYLGTHKLTAGASFEHQMANNSYMRNGSGYYRYKSLDDFINMRAPESVCLTYGYDGNLKPAAEVNFNQYGLYLQDEWTPTEDLKISAGIRFDNIAFDNDDLKQNKNIEALDFGGRHIITNQWPKSNIQISPRLGFNWDVFGDKKLTLRGGTGLFTGRLPLVFFTNMPSNAGMVQNVASITTKYDSNGMPSSVDPLLKHFEGPMITDRVKLMEELNKLDKDRFPTSISPENGPIPNSIASVDRDFKMPQVWKSSIAFDYNLPISFPLTLTGEFMYTRNINDVRLENYNMKNPDESWERFKGADNRFIYPKNKYYSDDWADKIRLYDASVLTNTHKGYGWTANVTLKAQPVKNLNLMLAYTHTVMKEISGMPGSNARSAWGGLTTVNGPNMARVQNSQYVVPDRVVASINYRYHKDSYSLFYSGFRPSGGTYVYDGDFNGDGVRGDLMYIPKDDSEINFRDKADREAFWDFVQQDSYLDSHRGQYAEANSVYAPFVHRFDFRWAHDFDIKIGNVDNKFQLSLDIMNVGNLFNSKWGVMKNMSACNWGKILRPAGVDNGTPYFKMNKDRATGEYLSKTFEYNHHQSQCWRMQIGLKYFFN